MKPILIIAAVVGLAAAQDIKTYVPECSLKCLTDAIGSVTTCKTDQGTCICDRPNFEAIYNWGQACVLQACGADKAIGEVLPATYKYCEDVLAAASGGTSRPGSTSTISVPPSPSSTAATTSAATTTTTTTRNTTTSSTGTQQSVSSTTVPGNGAAVATAGTVGMMAMLGLGALGLL